MTISQISAAVAKPNPAKINPLAKSDSSAVAAQANQVASKSVQAAKTDTVTFSKAALQKLSEGSAAVAKTATGKQEPPAAKKISVKA